MKNMALLGDSDEVRKMPGTNRVGSALSVGGVYSRDFKASATESKSGGTVVARQARSNIVAAATANLPLPKVVAEAATADNAEGMFVERGPVLALADDTVTAGDYLKVTDGTNAYVTATSGTYAHAIAIGEHSGATASLIEVIQLDIPVYIP